LVLIAIGVLPLRYWQSFRDRVPRDDSSGASKGDAALKPA
jgi:hypothetical protein